MERGSMSALTARGRLVQLLGNISGAVASVCLPASCRLCEELLSDARRLPICDRCLESFPKIPPGSCDVCGLPGTFDPEFPKERSLCADCQERRFGFELARSFGIYEGALARAILLLKHEQIEPLGAWFAQRLAEVVQRELERFAADRRFRFHSTGNAAGREALIRLTCSGGSSRGNCVWRTSRCY